MSDEPELIATPLDHPEYLATGRGVPGRLVAGGVDIPAVRFGNVITFASAQRPKDRTVDGTFADDPVRVRITPGAWSKGGYGKPSYPFATATIVT